MGRKDSQRLAIITGASAGIGLGIAKKFASEGIRSIGIARRAEKLRQVELELNAGNDKVPLFVGIVGDAALESTLDRALEECEARFGGKPDIFVINAGRGLPGSVLESDEKLWEEMFRINMMGALRAMKAAGRMMIESAQVEAGLRRARDVVVLGSVVGRIVSPFNPVYGATKFAVNSLAEALRQELSKHFIRVTLIEPGIVRTEFQDVAKYDMVQFGKYEEEIGPFLLAEDIANLVSFIIAQPSHVHFNDVVVRPTRQAWP